MPAKKHAQLNIMSPYGLAMDLHDFFRSSDGGGQGFEHGELLDIVETLQATGNVKNQEHTYKLFKTLKRDEVARRSKIVSRLYRMLANIKLNSRRHVISSTSPV